MGQVDEIRARREAKEQAAAERQYRRELKARDREHQRAYQSGKRGGQREEFDGDEDLQATFDQGASETNDDRRSERRTARRARVSKTFAKPLRAAERQGVDVVSDGAGLLLGMVAYALLINYLKGGAPQVRGWLAAKFINKPYTVPSSGPGSVITPAAPSPQFYTPPNPADLTRRGRPS